MKRTILLSTLLAFSFPFASGDFHVIAKKTSKTFVSIKGESIPVNWGVSPPRKKAFFNKLEEITG
jgi:hypothetical protein